MVESQSEISPKIRLLYEQPTAGLVISTAVKLLREEPPSKRTILWRNHGFRTIVSAALAGSDEHQAERLKELNDARDASV